MSSTLTSTSRKRTATDMFRDIGTSMELEDEKLVAIAIAEAALQEIENNRLFASRVRTLYEAYASTKRPRPKKAESNEKNGETEKPELVPLRTLQGDYYLDAAGPPDIASLVYVFGIPQLALALDGYSKERLLMAVEQIEKRHNIMMKGKSKATIVKLIAFLVAEAEKGHV
jgi:hypothetical protein